MRGAVQYKTSSYVTSKVLNVVHLLGCDRCYGSDKKTKTLDGGILDKFNESTKTGRSGWFARAWFYLGCGQTKLAELDVCSVKKVDDLIICEEEPSDTLPLPDIPEATTIYSRLRVDTIVVPDEESETTNKEGPPPVLTSPPNPEEVIPTTPDAD